MNTVQRIAKNAILLYLAYVVTHLLSLLLFIYIARILGDVILGKYSFALAFTTLFAVFLTLGLNTLITREVSRDKSLASKYLGNITVIKAILSVIVFGLITLVIIVMRSSTDTTGAVLILGVYIIFTSFADIYRGIFRAFERMEYEALVSSVGRLVTVSLGLAALFLGYGLIEVVCALLIGSIVDFFLGSFICNRKFVRLSLEIDFEFWKKVAKSALPLGFFAIASMIFVRVDTVMLSAMKGDAVVGWYSAAYNLVLALKPIPVVFTTTVLPLMARFFVSSESSLKLTYEKTLYYLFIVGLPLAVGTMLISDRIILIAYGGEFSHSIIALQILAWDVLLFFLYTPLAMLLVSIDRQSRMAIAGGICVVTNVILNLILIPHFSYVGAGIATIVTETVLLGIYFYFVSRYLYRLPLAGIMIKPIAACIAMAVFIYFCQGLNLALLVILAIAIYFGMLYLIKGFSREDIDLLAQVIKIPRMLLQSRGDSGRDKK